MLICRQFHESEEALEDSSFEASDKSDSDDDHGFVLGLAKKPHFRYLHPPTEHIHQLWQIFIENVDPLTKIVHVPSLQPAIQKATTDIERGPRNFEALMFAIYAAAVMSLNDDECKRRLGEPREHLLSHYTSATKWALSQAKFMGTMNIVVLQALVLHLFSVRIFYGPRTVWTLTGVAIRIAEGIGLHRDAASLRAPPFEAEIRARIWWQLKMHDSRATELIGLAKFRGFDSGDDTCKPSANINDNELYPGMPSPATSSTKLTDMIFVVFKTELASFARRRGAKFREQEKNTNQLDDIAARSDQETKEDFIKDIEETLERKYLRYCDPSQPLQLLTMLVAQFSLNVVRFVAHHPRRWASQEQTPKSEQEYVWTISIALLEQHDTIQSDRRLQGFAWHAGYFLHWHVLIHVLDTLRAKPLMPDIHKAWRLVEATYRNNPDMISSLKKPIHVAVGNLCLNAFNAYEAALMHKGMNILDEPDYITKLRQQREAAKARRKARATRDPRFSLSEGDFNTNKPQQNSSFQSTNLDQENESDPFWLASGLNNNVYRTAGDIMSTDTDFMLAQDYNLENVTDQGIDWAQWDAWLDE